MIIDMDLELHKPMVLVESHLITLLLIDGQLVLLTLVMVLVELCLVDLVFLL